MIRKIPTPDRPHFIFSGKMWEIEQKCKEIAGGRYRTFVTFEHINKTCVIDDEIGFQESAKLPEGSAWTIIETVTVEIDDEFSEPVITMFKRNIGTIVNKRDMKEIETFSLPLYHIQKLVDEAKKMDMKNRFRRAEKQRQGREMLE